MKVWLTIGYSMDTKREITHKWARKWFGSGEIPPVSKPVPPSSPSKTFIINFCFKLKLFY